jgi:hypothetical protein
VCVCMRVPAWMKAVCTLVYLTECVYVFVCLCALVCVYMCVCLCMDEENNRESFL